jgi:hypothetical protein
VPAELAELVTAGLQDATAVLDDDSTTVGEPLVRLTQQAAVRLEPLAGGEDGIRRLRSQVDVFGTIPEPPRQVRKVGDDEVERAAHGPEQVGLEEGDPRAEAGGERRASAATVPSPAKKVPAIAAYAS